MGRRAAGKLNNAVRPKPEYCRVQTQACVSCWAIVSAVAVTNELQGSGSTWLRQGPSYKCRRAPIVEYKASGFLLAPGVDAAPPGVDSRVPAVELVLPVTHIGSRLLPAGAALLPVAARLLLALLCML